MWKSYLPENIRVEEQAFGRTARNGAQGTVHFILLVDKSIYEEMYDLNQYTNEQKWIKLENLAEIIIEEELFEKFNEFKKKIAEEIFKSLFSNRLEKFCEKFVEDFENILKNRWAFLLDKAKQEIDNITTYYQNIFIDQPEEAISIGKVCLSENEIPMAKQCFEKGILIGDISDFSHIALAYCIINLGTEDLHYLYQAVGETIEPFDLILHPKDDQKLTKTDHEQGEKLYNFLVQHKLIRGDRIRKVFRKDSNERIKMEENIRHHLDPSIADELINLLNNKALFEKEDFENIFRLDKTRVEKELPQEYENIWKDLENQIDIQDVKESLFENTLEKKKFKIYLKEKQILIQTRRVKIERS
ncbi:unnamed protein product [Rotaria sp. Silwood2]|nr:unnamed protein product [Rotaria sp. Silwood2]